MAGAVRTQWQVMGEERCGSKDGSGSQDFIARCCSCAHFRHMASKAAANTEGFSAYSRSPSANALDCKLSATIVDGFEQRFNYLGIELPTRLQHCRPQYGEVVLLAKILRDAVELIR